MVTQFLQTHTIDDVLTPIVGELLEYSCDEFSAWYGNGELIIESDTESRIYVVDRYGYQAFLVPY